MTKFDLVSAGKQVDIFDYYWDLYRYDFVNMTQSEGKKQIPNYGTIQTKRKRKSDYLF